MKHATFVFFASAAFVFAPIVVSSVRADETQTAVTKSAAEAFERGKAKLAAGQFKEALAEYKTASTSDAKNATYAKAYKSLEKAIEFQALLSSESDPKKWIAVARALHNYYHQNSAFAAAKELDEKTYRKYENTLAALLLAQSYVALNQNEEAAALLAKLPSKNQTNETKALQASALYRAGKKEEAEKLVKTISFSKNPCAGKAFSYAKLYATLEQYDESAKYLRTAFEQAPASKLDAFKETAKETDGLGKLLANPKYADLLAVQSKAGSEHHDDGETHNDADSAPRHQCLDCPAQRRVDDSTKKENAETKSAAEK